MLLLIQLSFQSFSFRYTLFSSLCRLSIFYFPFTTPPRAYLYFTGIRAPRTDACPPPLRLLNMSAKPNRFLVIFVFLVVFTGTALSPLLHMCIQAYACLFPRCVIFTLFHWSTLTQHFALSTLFLSLCGFQIVGWGSCCVAPPSSHALFALCGFPHPLLSCTPVKYIAPNFTRCVTAVLTFTLVLCFLSAPSHLLASLFFHL